MKPLAQIPSLPPDWRPWTDAADAWLAHHEGRLSSIRRHLHAHPELSGCETETTAYLAALLDDAGIPARILRNDIGLITDLRLGTPREDAPLIALRADIDALPIQDRKQVSYASTHPGVAHACGHDAHATVVLGAALAGFRAAAALPAEQGVRLRILFQPAEETSDGARWLVEQGALDDVDFVLGLHADPERRVGEVGIRYGPLTASCDDLALRIEGRGGHAARPFQSQDPVAAAAQLVSALYQRIPRSVDPRNATVLSITRIHAGSATNVIPDTAELAGTLRATDPESRARLKEVIQNVCSGVASVTGTRIECRFENALASVVNHPHAAAALENAATSILHPGEVTRIDRPSMGGEDFAVYTERVPGAMMRLGIARDPNSQPLLHTPDFDIDERALALGARILLRAAAHLTLAANPEAAVRTVLPA